MSHRQQVSMRQRLGWVSRLGSQPRLGTSTLPLVLYLVAALLAAQMAAVLHGIGHVHVLGPAPILEPSASPAAFGKALVIGDHHECDHNHAHGNAHDRAHEHAHEHAHDDDRGDALGSAHASQHGVSTSWVQRIADALHGSGGISCAAIDHHLAADAALTGSGLAWASVPMRVPPSSLVGPRLERVRIAAWPRGPPVSSAQQSLVA